MKITYTDKEYLDINSDVPDKNKVTDDDLNEIKNVVNNNYDEVGDISSLSTNDKTSVVNAINEVVSDIDNLFSITQETIVSGLSLAAGKYTDVVTKNIAKSGYRPLGVVGYFFTGTYHQQVIALGLQLANIVDGGGDVQYRISNTSTYSNAATINLFAMILWKKI